MRSSARTTLAVIILAVFATGLNAAWWFRHDIRDAYERLRRGPLPDALTYEQAKDDAGAVAREALLRDIEDRASDTPAEAAAPGPRRSEVPTADGEAAAEEHDDGETLGEEELAAVALRKKKDAELAALAERRSRMEGAFNLAVPFMSQAPLGEWDELHNEACEEASALMVKAFLEGEASISPEDAERRILDLAAYEERTLGSSLDTTAEQTVSFMRGHLGLASAKAVTISSLDDVRSYVATGVPVILPAYGKALGNPYFRGEGPLYHMLVVKGFKDDLIIVNDPGTKRGEDFVYDAETLWAAVHDWNGGDVQNGAKVMIVPE